MTPDEFVEGLETAAEEQARELREADGGDLSDVALGAVADLEVER